MSSFLKKLLPRRCCLCDRHATNNQNLCQHCINELPVITQFCTSCALPLEGRDVTTCGSCANSPPPWRNCVVSFIYETPADYLVKRFKYAADRAAGRAMAERMWTSGVEYRDDLAGALFIPVPLHRSRLIDRGFNQAEFLARYLAKKCAGVYAPQALIRTRATGTQLGLSKKQRLENIKNAFKANDLVKGECVVLVDDVLTTGSTAGACAKALQASGVDDLTLWCFARAPERKR